MENQYLHVFLAGLVSFGLLTGCLDKTQADVTKTTDTPHPALPASAATPENTGNKLYGSVVETFDTGGYTYIQLDNGKEKFWAAGPLTKLTPGAMVSISTRMPMKNYHSKHLNRDFELIYFTDRIITDTHKEGHDAEPAAMNPHYGITHTPASSPVPVIKKAEGGKTIKEIISQKDELAGKTVRVRGKVVKFTSEVLGRNWIHILDGSTGVDLTITTNGSANIDDIIIAEGTLGLGKNFGYGYVYDVILEKASITKD